MSKKRSARKSVESNEIPMTPMIDVVFQLLIYFVLTITPVDVTAHLDVFSPSSTSESTEPPPPMLKAEIYPGTILLNGTGMDTNRFRAVMASLGTTDAGKRQTVMILCHVDSRHADLMSVLDTCAMVGMSNLTVSSMK